MIQGQSSRELGHPYLPTIALANYFQNPTASIYNRYYHLGVAQLLAESEVLETQKSPLG